MAQRSSAGGKKPADAAAQRRVRVSRAPSYPMHPHGQKGHVFLPDDVHQLAEAAGLPLVEGADRAVIARDLEQAISMAVGWQRLDELSPPDRQVVDFLATVEIRARELLDVLREPIDIRECEGKAANARDWYLHLAPGLWAPCPPRFWLTMSDADHRNLYLSFAIKRLESRREFFHTMDVSIAEQDAELYRQGSKSMLTAVPTMLRTLTETARLARVKRETAAAKPEGRHPGGRPPSTVNRLLFRDLGLIHQRMFGCAPVIKGQVADRYGPGVDWARAVLKLAQDRLPAVLINPDPRDLAIIAKVMALSADRIAVLLIRSAAAEKAQRKGT